MYCNLDIEAVGVGPNASTGVVVGVWIGCWIFGRAGRPNWSKASDGRTDGLTAGSCCGPKKLQAGQRPAVHCAVINVWIVFGLDFWLFGPVCVVKGF